MATAIDLATWNAIATGNIVENCIRNDNFNYLGDRIGMRYDVADHCNYVATCICIDVGKKLSPAVYNNISACNVLKILK